MPKGPLGLSIWGKLLLAAAYTRIFVTSLDDAGQQITIDWTVRVLCDTSHKKVLLCEVSVSAQTCVCEEELEYINLHADDGAISLLSILSDTHIHKARRCADPVCTISIRMWMCSFLCICVIYVFVQVGIQLDAYLRSEQHEVGISLSEVSDYCPDIFYSILLFRVREKRGMGEEG